MRQGGDMVVEKEGWHVLGLYPREQYVLRLLLGNLMAAHIDKSIMDSRDQTIDGLDQKAHIAVSLFRRFNEFTDLLCSETMLSRAKPKVITLQTYMINYAVNAVKGYDVKNCYLSNEEKQAVEPYFKDLSMKVITSSQYTYSDSELAKAKQEVG